MYAKGVKHSEEKHWETMHNSPKIKGPTTVNFLALS